MADPQTADKQALGAFARVDETDAGDFIERLDRMHLVEDFRIYKTRSMEAMRIAPGARVADIGCGAGDDAAQLAMLVGAGGHASGVDLSQSMVDEAARRFADTGNLAFVCASVDKLPFADDSLDAIRADRVLIHVPDPQAAVAEMIRVTKPGGRIVISEPDMVGFWVAGSDWEISEGIARAIAMSCTSPYLPRDMGNMMHDCNLKDVRHSAYAMISGDFETVNRVVQFERVIAGLKAAGRAPADRLDAWWQEQQARTAQDRFCAGLNVITASGTKAGDRSIFF